MEDQTKRRALATGGALVGGAAAVAAVMKGGQPRPATYDMSGRNVVITGGNSGIGLETAVALARGGARTIITSRDLERGATAVDMIRSRSGSSSVEMVQLNLSSLASVHAAADELAGRVAGIDVLVNNAGAIVGEQSETEDGFETTIGANHLGPFLLTGLLLPLLRAAAPSRIVNVSSLTHRKGVIDLDDLMNTSRPYVPLDAYANSKLANLLFSNELARRLAGTGVTSNALHPGTVSSGFGADGDTTGPFRMLLAVAKPLMVDPERGASTTVYAAGDPGLAGVSGKYFSRRRSVRPSAAGRDVALAGDLWRRSEELVGIRY